MSTISFFDRQIRLLKLFNIYSLEYFNDTVMHMLCDDKSNRKAMNRNWSNQKANPALKTKTGNK